MDDAQLQQLAHIFKVLGEVSRLALLKILMHEHECTVSQLVDKSGLSQANTSKHLKALFHAKLVSCRKLGNHVLYKIQNPLVFHICELCCQNLDQQEAQLFIELRQKWEAKL